MPYALMMERSEPTRSIRSTVHRSLTASLSHAFRWNSRQRGLLHQYRKPPDRVAVLDCHRSREGRRCGGGHRHHARRAATAGRHIFTAVPIAVRNSVARRKILSSIPTRPKTGGLVQGASDISKTRFTNCLRQTAGGNERKVDAGRYLLRRWHRSSAPSVVRAAPPVPPGQGARVGLVIQPSSGSAFLGRP